jgi:hypothetical protein
VTQGPRWLGPDGGRYGAVAVRDAWDRLVKGAGEVAAGLPIVMGLDQHRAQITAEWIDRASGEVSRGRVAPADRAALRRFLRRFASTHARSGAAEAGRRTAFALGRLGAVGSGAFAQRSGQVLPAQQPAASRARLTGRYVRRLLGSWLELGYQVRRRRGQR